MPKSHTNTVSELIFAPMGRLVIFAQTKNSVFADMDIFAKCEPGHKFCQASLVGDATDQPAHVDPLVLAAEGKSCGQQVSDRSAWRIVLVRDE